MGPSEHILRGIARFEGAADGEEAFAEAVEELCDALGADCGTLEITDRPASGLLLFAEARIDPAGTEEYKSHYHAISPRVRYGMNPEARPVIRDTDILTEREMDRDPFYAEFLSRLRLRYFLSVAVDPDPDTFAVLAFQFRPQHGLVSHEKLRLAWAMRPLLTRAMRRYWLAQFSGDRDRVGRDLTWRFGLTQAEVRLACAILSGTSVSDHAEQTGITRNTAYTHYARLKEKLNCRRQVELVAFLHRQYPRSLAWREGGIVLPKSTF